MGFWVLGFGCWVLGFGCWVLGFGFGRVGVWGFESLLGDSWVARTGVLSRGSMAMTGWNLGWDHLLKSPLGFRV